ncbi:MAG TPA: M20 family metallopeptidase [Nitriliruptorales bacterium]
MGQFVIDRDALVAFTQELVRIPSVNRPEDGLTEQPAADLVAGRMRAFGWDPTIEEVAPGRPNVIAVVEGASPGPTLLFEGHTDVVTEGDPQAWSHPPFGGEIVDGRLYGRGSADMKSGVAAMLYATAAVAQAGPFPGRIVVAALVDEEGMMLGVKDFVARGHAQGVDAAIVCEPEEREICTVQKGAMRLRVVAIGRMAHGAMPDHGVNPLPALARVVELAATVEAELQASVGEHQHLGLTYVTPTVLSAGSAAQMNVIPREGWVAIDVRTIPGVDHAELRQRLLKGLEAIQDDTRVALALEIVEDRPPTETDVDEPVVRAVAAAHEHVYQEPAQYGGVPGTTDGTILWRDAGIPVVVYGPGGKWIAHQADEYVEVDDIVACAQVYAHAAHAFLTGATGAT